MTLEHSSDEEQTEKELPERADEALGVGEEQNVQTEEDEETPAPFASARDLPRPATNLPFPPSGEVSELTVTLLSGIELALSLEEIEKMNSREGGPRTPMMAVVHAVIANAGGTISIRDLAEKVRRYWNRPLPMSPYTPEEFMYMTAQDSDDLRVNG